MFIETVLSPSIANRKPNVTYSGRNLFIIFTNKLRLRYNIYAYYLSYFQYFHHLILSSLNFTARRRDYSCDVQCWNNLNNKKEVATKRRRCRRNCSRSRGLPYINCLNIDYDTSILGASHTYTHLHRHNYAAYKCIRPQVNRPREAQSRELNSLILL